TRFDCDWSSDVCSSDLGEDRREEVAHVDDIMRFAAAFDLPSPAHDRRHAHAAFPERAFLPAKGAVGIKVGGARAGELFERRAVRSEERRVGKECGARWV